MREKEKKVQHLHGILLAGGAYYAGRHGEPYFVMLLEIIKLLAIPYSRWSTHKADEAVAMPWPGFSNILTCPAGKKWLFWKGGLGFDFFFFVWLLTVILYPVCKPARPPKGSN